MQSSLLPFFGVVRVSGDDRATFLHNQLSNHIEALADGQACYATYNTPKGRVIANMLVINRGEDLLLVMAADLIESTIKRLRMFVLRAKVCLKHYQSSALPVNWQTTTRRSRRPNHNWHLLHCKMKISAAYRCRMAAYCW